MQDENKWIAFLQINAPIKSKVGPSFLVMCVLKSVFGYSEVRVCVCVCVCVYLSASLGMKD